MITIIIVII